MNNTSAKDGYVLVMVMAIMLILFATLSVATMMQVQALRDHRDAQQELQQRAEALHLVVDSSRNDSATTSP